MFPDRSIYYTHKPIFLHWLFSKRKLWSVLLKWMLCLPAVWGILHGEGNDGELYRDPYRDVGGLRVGAWCLLHSMPYAFPGGFDSRDGEMPARSCHQELEKEEGSEEKWGRGEGNWKREKAAPYSLWLTNQRGNYYRLHLKKDKCLCRKHCL